MIKGKNDRKQGLMRIHDLMQTRGEDDRPFLMVMDNCTHWLRTVPYMTYDPRDPEDVNTEMEDHAYDALRYSVMSEYSRNPKALRQREVLPALSRQEPYDELRHGLTHEGVTRDPDKGVLIRSY